VRQEPADPFLPRDLEDAQGGHEIALRGDVTAPTRRILYQSGPEWIAGGEKARQGDLKSDQDFSESQDNAVLQGNEVLSRPEG
jgi:hypothetical protein